MRGDNALVAAKQVAAGAVPSETSNDKQDASGALLSVRSLPVARSDVQCDPTVCVWLAQGASFMQHYLGAHLQNDKAMKMAATQWQVLVDR